MLQEGCWQMEEIMLVGVVWDISMLKAKLKGKEVHVEISFGDMTQERQQNLSEPAIDGIPSRFIYIYIRFSKLIHHCTDSDNISIYSLSITSRMFLCFLCFPEVPSLLFVYKKCLTHFI
jgi:hypothetical protein